MTTHPLTADDLANTTTTNEACSLLAQALPDINPAHYLPHYERDDLNRAEANYALAIARLHAEQNARGQRMEKTLRTIHQSKLWTPRELKTLAPV